MRKISLLGEKYAAVFTLRKNDVQYTRRNSEKVAGTNIHGERVINRSAENQAAVTFAGTAFFSSWYGTRDEAKEDIAVQVIQFINNMTFDGAVLAELGRVECTNTPSLQVNPGQLWWEVELQALGLTKKNNKKSKAAHANRRNKLLKRYPGYFRDLFWNCQSCRVLNYEKYPSCHKCGGLKEEAERKEGNIGILDLERTGKGHQEATPLSIGIVTVTPQGEVTNEKEIFILPEEGGRWPDPTLHSYNTKNIHHLYIQKKGGTRKLYKLGSKEPITTVTEEKAVEMFMEYLRRNKIDTILFHGEDHLSLRPFLAKYGVGILGFSMYDTRSFFESMERARLNMLFDSVVKTKMEVMVGQYGTDEVKERYRNDKHSSAVDAWALAHMLTTDNCFNDLHIWLESRVTSL